MSICFLLLVLFSWGYGFTIENLKLKPLELTDYFPASSNQIWMKINDGFVLSDLNEDYLEKQKKSITLKTAVIPFVWQIWWVWILAILLGLVIIWKYRTILHQNQILKRLVDEHTNELQSQRDNLQEMVQTQTLELKIAKEKAEHSDHLKSVFLANMSHEIRTPMNAIMGFLEVLSFSDLSEDEHQHFTRMVLQSGETLVTLIDDILDLSMIEADELLINPKKCDVDELCYGISEIFRETTQKDKDGRVKVEFRRNGELTNKRKIKNPLSMEIDPIRLKQILLNLMSNALKFTESGEVVLNYETEGNGSRKGGKYVSFSVSDTGIGIPIDQLDEVFDRFHKVRSTGEKLYRGTGLGLTISTKLAKLMGGSISVESVLGEGSVFTVRLPWVDEYSSAKPTRVSVKKGNYHRAFALDGMDDLSAYSILVAEDEEPNYAFIEEVLSRTGMRIVWAKNGEEALGLYEKETFDLVLLDLKMPRISGFEVIRSIRGINPDIPIIVQSAFAMEEDRQVCSDAGSTDFIAKPFTIEQLYSTLKKHLNA